MPFPFIHRDQVVVQRTVAVGFLDVEGTGLDGGGDLEKEDRVKKDGSQYYWGR